MFENFHFLYNFHNFHAALSKITIVRSVIWNAVVNLKFYQKVVTCESKVGKIVFRNCRQIFFAQKLKNKLKFAFSAKFSTSKCEVEKYSTGLRQTFSKCRKQV